jgi:lambda family phage minor tail protein L
MTTAQDIHLSSPGAIIELYMLDASSVGQGVFYFSPHSNEKGTGVVWAGNTYAGIPVVGDGWTKSTNGSAPRPTITVDNTQRAMQVAVIAAGDLVGCPLTRTRVFARYLDAANFYAGNAAADTTQILSTDKFLINRKISHNNTAIQWELCWNIDKPGVRLPRRQVLRDFGFPGVGLNAQ